MNETAIREELARILASEAFQRSERCSGLLRYIVEQHLAGRADLLQGTTIAQDVFGRDERFDSGVDSIVRVQAGRLRQLLDGYYKGPGADDPVIILVPKGGYAPVIESRTTSAPPDAAAGHDAERPAFRLPSVAGYRRWIALAASLAVSVVLAAMLITRGPGDVAAGPQFDGAREIPTGPKIYVSQFSYTGDERLANVFSKGFQIELIDRLSRFKNLFVYSPNAMPPGAGENLAENAEDNAATPDFILSGSIGFVGDTLTVTSQLRDVSRSSVIWSQSFEDVHTSPVNIADVKSSIVSEVAAAVGQPYGVVQSYMNTNPAGIEDITFDDYVCILLFYDYARMKTPEKHAHVRDCLEKATTDSPSYSMGWAALSWIYGDEVRYGFNRRRRGSPPRDRALEAAEKAVATDPYNAAAHLYMAIALFAKGDENGFRHAAETSLSLNPNDSEALASLGWDFIVLDGSETGRAMVEKAIKLNPGSPPWFHGGLAIYHYRKGNYEEAYNQAISYYKADTALAEIMMAAVCVRLERFEEAAGYWAEFNAKHPEMAAKPHIAMEPWRFPEPLIKQITGDLETAHAFLDKA